MQKRKDQQRTALEDIQDIFVNWYRNSKASSDTHNVEKAHIVALGSAKVEKIEHTKAKARTQTLFCCIGKFLI